MLKKYILLIQLLGAILIASEFTESRETSYNVASSLLKSIDSDAIVLGSGEKIIYVFIDPLCKHSRKFVSLVSKKKMMLSKYQYRFFLYTLPRLKSEDVVSAIYMSKTPTKSLLDVMVDKKLLSQKGNTMTDKKTQRIAKTAKKIGVSKRPYIFIMKPSKEGL